MRTVAKLAVETIAPTNKRKTAGDECAAANVPGKLNVECVKTSES